MIGQTNRQLEITTIYKDTVPEININKTYCKKYRTYLFCIVYTVPDIDYRDILYTVPDIEIYLCSTR